MINVFLITIEGVIIIIAGILAYYKIRQAPYMWFVSQAIILIVFIIFSDAFIKAFGA